MGLALMGGISMLVQQPASAVSADTQIGVAVCGQDMTGSTIAINEPRDDSVINTSTVVLRGDIANTSQIEIRIDGNYSSTVAVGAEQRTFEVETALTSGTHTIELTAIDVCQVQESKDSVVVTYQPVDAPSSGDSVPTDVGGVFVGPEATSGELTPASTSEGISNIPVIGAIAVGFERLFQEIGLDATLNGTTASVNTARVALTITALSTVVLASVIAPLVVQAAPFIPTGQPAAARLRTFRQVRWGLRGFGAVALLIAFTL